MFVRFSLGSRLGNHSAFFRLSVDVRCVFYRLSFMLVKFSVDLLLEVRLVLAKFSLGFVRIA